MENACINSLEKVVNNGFCVGCGACAFALNIPMALNSFGEYNPDFSIVDKDKGGLYPDVDIIKTCPFLAPELNEDELSRPLFEKDCELDSRIGYYHSTYAGYAKESNYRSNGTSGGMGTWIGAELLKQGLIDAVIHVKPIGNRVDGDPYFKYAISDSLDDIMQGAKTRYHVVEISEVMSVVRERPGKYLFLGLPCLSKAVRRLQLIDGVIADRIEYVASLVCGHLKSVHWTLSLAWGAGIHPTNLKAFQYRSKGKDIPARAYVFRATSNKIGQDVIQKNSAEVVGGKFNAGALSLYACDYCDDVVGETADITIGDAWIPRFDVDSGGTNLLIIRNSKLDKILRTAEKEGRIWLSKITADEAGDSQSGGFRQRREGLSYRLEKHKDTWVPIKRIKPGSFKISSTRRKIYDKRTSIALMSRDIFKKALDANDYSIYKNSMEAEFKNLRSLEIRSSLFRSIWGRVKRYLYAIKR
ncbi:MAG TPA: coenzyme F420 hydrogenase [Gammaproteobacteria bacterium]|nr:coenzyme F420 hydrogenase [Gammaproteobacteria bacterium]